MQYYYIKGLLSIKVFAKCFEIKKYKGAIDIKDYFKGWYFKCSTAENTIAFIPAYHRSNQEERASLQIITDKAAFNIPFYSLKYDEQGPKIKIGGSLFSSKGIKLDIHTKQLTATGELRFYGLSPIGYDIMGPFKYVPFMQCRHSVYSMRHRIEGQITVNGEQYVFNNGAGYIEGDEGTSFPNRYIWTQCCFSKGSFMLSAADIPFAGFRFTGIIGVVLLKDREYRIATYLGAKIKHMRKNTITIEQGKYQLTAKLIYKNSHPLYAPEKGKMSRTIYESASCKAYYRFSYKGKPLCEFQSNRASFEYD